MKPPWDSQQNVGETLLLQGDPKSLYYIDGVPASRIGITTVSNDLVRFSAVGDWEYLSYPKKKLAETVRGNGC